MRSSWGCFWLVLAWVLLLGHPALGQEEEYQAAPLEEPDDSVEVEWMGEPEDLLVSVVEQDGFEEPEDLLETEDDVPLTEEELEEEREYRALVEPDEEELRLQNLALLYRRDMRREKRVGFYKDMALEYMKRNKYDEEDPDAVYRPMEDSSINVKKAFGNIIKFRLFLTKGYCKDLPGYSEYLYDFMSPRRRHKERTNCPHFVSPTRPQKLDCVFTVFQDVRTGHEAVISSDCHPLVLAEEMDYWNRYGHRAMLYDDYDYANHNSAGEDIWSDVATSDEDTPDVSASDEDTFEEPLSDDDAPYYAPTSSLDTPDTPDSEGDTPDDDANQNTVY